MKINKLNLINFGRFNKKEIEFSQGINIVYGENEKGKSTIHSFIDGMFYGFLRPYAKRTLYREEHEKYSPWNDTKYLGTMDLEFQGENYSIERDFRKGNERLTVFNKTTGSDITSDIDIGKGRVLQPGRFFLGLNDAVYLNTISIAQLTNETDGNLANEVRDRLINLSSSKSEEISVEDASKILTGKIKDIGSERAVTSPYGSSRKKIDNLITRQKDLQKDRYEYEMVLEKDSQVEESLVSLEEEIKELEETLNLSKGYEDKLLVEKLENMDSDLADLAKKHESLIKYKDIDMDDYSKLISLDKELENLSFRIKEIDSQMSQLEFELEGFELEEDNREDDAYRDYLKAEELDISVKDLYAELNQKDSISLKDRLDKKIGRSKSLKGQEFILGLMTLISIILGVFLKKYIILAFNIILLPALLYIKGKRSDILEEISGFKDELELMEKEKKELLSRIEILEEREREILERQGVTNLSDLKAKGDKAYIYLINKENREKTRLEKRNQLEKLIDLSTSKKKIYDEVILESKRILEENSLESIDDYKEALNKKKEYEEIDLKKENILSLRESILENRSLEDLKKNIEGISFKDFTYIEVDKLEKELGIKREKLNEFNTEKRVMEERLDNLNKSISELLEIDEEIEILESNLRKMDEELAALELARNTISLLSEDIHREFAPDINKKIASIIEKITNGKYKDVRIDENLNISIVDPDDGVLINLDSLSGGTKDQLYFALRFGIIDDVTDGSLPLILDDCFIQYDDIRLERMLRFLNNEGDKRQIILFTCQTREKKILDRMEANYNYIEL